MKITETQLKQIIKEEISEVYVHPAGHPPKSSDLDEGLENINPENLQVALQVIEKMATQPEVAVALAVGGLAAAVIKIRELVKNNASPAAEPSGPNKFRQAASIARDHK